MGELFTAEVAAGESTLPVLQLPAPLAWLSDEGCASCCAQIPALNHSCLCCVSVGAEGERRT